MAATTTEAAFIDWALRKLNQSHERVQACAARLTDEQTWFRGGTNENAMGNLLLHLCGNMLQWIGTGVAGQPDTRDRDSEFETEGGIDRAQLTALLTKVVDFTSQVIRDIPHAQLTDPITSVQGYQVTKLEAIGHVVEHFVYHTGQIVFLTKALTHEDLCFYAHLRGAGAHRETTP